MLRRRQLDDLRFHRQHPIGPYVVDFCCVAERLVVEADGGIHERLLQERDQKRDAWLASQGFKVLRFGNEQIISRPNEVVAAIRNAVGRCVDTPHPSRFASHLPPQGGKEMTCEFWFYHLERSCWDQVLPGLLEKTLERGWRARVRVGRPFDARQVDERLWTYRDDGFLPHGRADEPHADRQPILIGDDAANLNGAQALFILGDAELGDTEGLERCFIIFDGADETALNDARGRWKALKAAGAALAYWKQSPEGRWEKAA